MAQQPEEKGFGEAYRDRLLEEIVSEDEPSSQTPIEPPTFPITRRDYFQTAGSVTALYGQAAPTTFDIYKLLGRESLNGSIIVDQITTGVGGVTVSINKGNNFNLNLGDQFVWPPIQWIVFPVRYIEIWAQASAGSNYRVFCV